MAAAEELRAAAYKGDCGKMRELLESGGASVVNERTEVMDSRTGGDVCSYNTIAALAATVCFGGCGGGAFEHWRLPHGASQPAPRQGAHSKPVGLEGLQVVHRGGYT